MRQEDFMAHFIDEYRSLALLIVLALLAESAASTMPKSPSSEDRRTKAIDKVFARYPSGEKEIWPISGHPRYAAVRPLQESTFASLREYFSGRQQRNVDQFLQALSDLIGARDRLAKKLDIREKWWPTGIDLLKVDAALTQDLLTGRTDNPDKISISTPRALDAKLEVSVQEAYMEHGQDRVLGQGHRTSTVTLVPEGDRWVIDEIKTTTTDAYGEISTETLTQRLQRAIEPLHAAEHAMEKLPQTLEVKKGVKPEN
jgi:hypothetical protein